jgi:Zn-dependent M28 family amino/carboxypeptidase
MRDANLIRRELEPSVPSAYAAPPITSVLLAESTTVALLTGEAIDGPTLLARGGAGDFPASFELSRPVTLRVPLASSTRERPYNIVALVEGSDPVLKHEYITVAAHLDGSVGVREVDGDRIYNSADDNATGSAATLAIAGQLMKGPRPRRSVIFIWDSGEERGLWGTRQFVHQPPVPLDRIVAHINVDMVGATRAPGTPDAESPNVAGPNEVYLIGPGVLSPTVDALISRVNADYLGMTLNRKDDRADSEFFYPRTDAGPYLERGILTVGFTTGTHPRYHLPSDEARHLDAKKIEAVARTVFASLWAMANTDERPRIERELPVSVPKYR